MKQKWPIIFVAILLIVLCPILLMVGFFLFQKPFVSLIVNGKVVAVAKRSFIQPFSNDASVDVYDGKMKIFSIWEDYFNFPIFIFPFADGKRFLCDYDDDTSKLDFVVDFRDSATSEPRSSTWPPNDNGMGNYVRTYMASRITNVVFDTKGVVRLPNYAEVQEVSSYLTSTTPTQIKAGFFVFTWTKEDLLLDLATNRQSVWPTTK